MSRDLYTEEEAKDIIRQIASALAYCHARGIVHRDIKPENILFASADRRVVKLVDFGLADDTGAQSPWNRKGTFLYSAPELHLSGGKITPKVDTWSVGCVLYGMLSGHAPFLVNRQGNLSWQISPMEGGAWDNISTELKQFIESLLCIDPNLRMTAENMLQSPWLAKSQTEFTKNSSLEAELMKKLKTHMKQMRSFQSKSLFRRMCSSILARQMEWSQTRVFYESFRRMDTLNDGTITFDEWVNIWKLLFDDAASGECEKVFAAVNLSNSGSIEFTEFLAACVDLSVVEESALWSAFSYFGPKDGHVKFSALKAGVMEALVCRDACDVVVMMDEELSCMRDVCIGFHDFKCMLRQEDPCHMEYCSVHHQYANERLFCNDSREKSPNSKESSSPCPSPRHSKYSGCNSRRSSVRLPPAQCLQKSPTHNRQKKNSSVLETPVESYNRIQLPPLMLPPLTLGGVSGRYTGGSSSRSLSPRITTRTSPCSSRNATCKMARSVASIRRICTSPKFHLDVSPEPTPCSKDDSNSTWASVAAVSA